MNQSNCFYEYGSYGFETGGVSVLIDFLACFIIKDHTQQNTLDTQQLGLIGTKP